MYAAEYILHRYQRLLQLAIPAVVAVDTARSCYVVGKLAQQRMDEWEEEEQQQLVASVSNIMRRATTRCQAADGDFWPKIVSARAGVLPTATAATATTATASAPTAMLDIFEDPLVGLLSTTDDSKNASTYTLEHNLINEDGTAAWTFSENAGCSTRAATTNPSPGVSHSIIYVTLDDVCDHLLQTMHLLSSAAITQSGQSRLVQAAAQHQRRFASEMLTVADSCREWCRSAVPWPQLSLVRKSALRCRLSWEGMTFPIRPSTGFATRTREINLSGL